MWSGPAQFYLPPPQPVARILSTDEYVQSTRYYYHCQTERLLTVGHPYFPVTDGHDKELIPKVSGNQYRVFRLLLPDPNKFAFADPNFYNPEHTRLVWRLQALEIGRGGPLGIASTGHPLFNKLGDTENPITYPEQTADDRLSVSFDPKQTQIFVVGNKPCTGCHWGIAPHCVEGHNPEEGNCPPIQLVNTEIEDGDMGEIGLGNIDFNALQADRSSAPLDVCATVSKWPDFLKMQADVTGDTMWFFGKRESLYARHFFCSGGKNGDDIPLPSGNETKYLLPSSEEGPKKRNVAPTSYFATPSGSLNSSDGNLFNRPYFLHKAQGPNNGIAWNNEIFVTCLDNSRNTNFRISVAADGQKKEEYTATSFKHFLRHVEIYELSLILEVCKIPLEGNVLAHIHALNPKVIENWQLGFVPMPTSNLEDKYRNLASLATKCADSEPKEDEDPYKNKSFWVVDCREKFSSELDQYSLGRRFLSQIRYTTTRRTRPTKRTRKSAETSKSAKRRRG